MSDDGQIQSPPSSTAPHHKPHITWSDPYAKALHAIESLAALLPSSLPPALSTAESPAAALVLEPSVSDAVSALLQRHDSGSADDALCAWLYDTFHSGDPDLRLAVLRHLPALCDAYLSRAALHKPLAGFESVLLAIYAHETAARSGQAVTATIPDLSHPSIYHEPSAAAKTAIPVENGSTELHLAVVSPSLEPHGTVRSTRRARIVGVALELYYNKISEIPVQSKIEFCQFCRRWAGPEENDDNEENNEKPRAKGRISLPWELLQPMLRILGHCVMGPDKNEELLQAGLAACRSMHRRALRDINPKAVLATMSLLNLAERAAGTSMEVVDHTEIAMTNVISV